MANDIALAQLYVNLDKWGREKLVDPSGIEPYSLREYYLKKRFDPIANLYRNTLLKQNREKWWILAGSNR